MTISDVRLRYVDLQYESVRESVSLVVKDQPSMIYGKHYYLIKGTKGYNRLTWDPKLIPNGIGLLSVMVESTLFQVTYARKVTT